MKKHGKEIKALRSRKGYLSDPPFDVVCFHGTKTYFSTEDLPGQEKEDRRLSQRDDTDGTTSGGTAGPHFFF